MSFHDNLAQIIIALLGNIAPPFNSQDNLTLEISSIYNIC